MIRQPKLYIRAPFLRPDLIVARGVRLGIASPLELRLHRAVQAERSAMERRRQAMSDAVHEAAKRRHRTLALDLIVSRRRARQEAET